MPMFYKNTKQYNVTFVSATTPLPKSGLVQISEILESTCKSHTTNSDDLYDIIDIRFCNSESSFTFPEFKKYFSNESDYTSVSISLSATASHFSAMFIFEPSVCSVIVESDVHTKAEVDDILLELYNKIKPIFNTAKCFSASSDDPIEIAYNKILTIPVVDSEGSLVDYDSVKPSILNEQSEEKTNELHNAENTPNAEHSTVKADSYKPFYKSIVFWTAVGAIAAIVVPSILHFI